MFRALYPFNSSDPGTLNANRDDVFCGMGTDSSELWMHVAGENGEVGYLPANYLELCKWADKKLTMHFIDEGIESIHRIASAVGKYTSRQQEQLRQLSNHRVYLANNYELFIKRGTRSDCLPIGSAPPPTLANESTSAVELSNQTLPTHAKSTSTDSASNQSDDVPTTAIGEPFEPDTELSTKPKQSGRKASGDYATGSDEAGQPSNQRMQHSADAMAAQLTELLRFKTGLSHEKSKIGVVALLQCLSSNDVSTNMMPAICQAIERDALPSTDGGEELSHDVVEMTSIFETIAECKDDSQQRSWHLHDDEGFILTKLSRLLEILTAGNPEALVSAITRDLDCVHSLVQYYQMETRSTLRAVMLQIFAALCTMSALFITTLLCSVLTIELVRDLTSTQDDQRLIYSAIVLSMLYSTGEQVPVNHDVLLSGCFVDWLLNKIETSETLRIVDVCIELLLSFNQHFTAANENTVLQRLSNQTEATILTQNFLKLFNEGEDPVKILPVDDEINSVLKFATDLYSLETTAQLLYTNDVKVLIDIIIRQLTDLSEQDKVRTDYLSLMQLIIANSDYHEHCHRKEDLVTALNQIEFEEESSTTQAEMDAIIAQEIRKLL